MTRNYQGDITRAKIMDFIDTYWRENGFSPTLRDIVNAGVGVTSTNTITYQLSVLEATGEILPRKPGLPRSIVPKWVMENIRKEP